MGLGSFWQIDEETPGRIEETFFWLEIGNLRIKG